MRFFLVDAFVDGSFSGNPAGVCLLDQEATSEWMQAVAAEINQAETAFVRLVDDGFELRWFTPTIEVDLCGHATLASAHALWASGCTLSEIVFLTRSGPLRARRDDDLIGLDFPSEPANQPPAIPQFTIEEALGCKVVSAQANRMDLLVELETEDMVRSLRPHLGLIADLPYRGLIVTAEGANYDFVSRFFGPAAGVPEDSVTGSAHCALAPFWAAKLGRDKLVGYQASRRGGEVAVELRGDRVLLGGRARTVVDGKLHL